MGRSRAAFYIEPGLLNAIKVCADFKHTSVGIKQSEIRTKDANKLAADTKKKTDAYKRNMKEFNTRTIECANLDCMQTILDVKDSTKCVIIAAINAQE